LNEYSFFLTLFLLSMITYVDRVCISGAENSIAGEMHFPTLRWAWSSVLLRWVMRLRKFPAGGWRTGLGRDWC
jgi:hypothetical protein